jgi:uncharacterized protein YhaN
MRLQKLVIYGFGQHENITIELKEGINVFFGWNEAGKTTIQQFMLNVLFGFPLRNQGLLRYEPKGGGRHGGQVHVLHPEFGTVIVERVKGKSAGDVTVYFEDGTKGKEEVLKKVLYSYDRGSFESIFSFSIHQLQSFEKMTEDELSRTLLASGTTGVDALTKLEQRAAKELNNLFKKSGKNPEMNVKIEEIRELEQLIKEERAKVDQYEPSILRMSEINMQLEDLTLKEKQLKKQNEQLLKLRQAKPLLEQEKQLDFNLKGLLQDKFPPEGIRRYELIKDRTQELTIQIEQLEKDIKLAEQFSTKSLSGENLKTIEELLSKESEWHQLQQRRQLLTTDLLNKKRELDQNIRMLGIKDESHLSQVIQMDVSLQKEEHFLQVLSGMQLAEEGIRFEKQGLERSEIELEEVKRKSEQIETMRPSVSDQQKVEALPHMIRQAAEFNAQQHWNKRTEQPKSDIHFLVSSLILIASIVGAVVLQNMWIAGCGILLAGVIFFLLIPNNQQNSSVKDNDVSEELASLEKEIERIQSIVNQVRTYAERKAHLVDQEEEKEKIIQTFKGNIQRATDNWNNSKEKLNEFLHLNGINGIEQPQLFPELFKRIRIVQEINQIINQQSDELQSITKQIQDFLLKLSTACNESLASDHAYSHLREKYLSIKEKQKNQFSSEVKVKEWMIQLGEKEKLLQLQIEELQSLWNEAQVQSETAFYEADVAFRKKQSLQQDLQAIQVQLDSIGEIVIPEENEGLQDEQLLQLDHQSQQISLTRNELLEEKAVLKQQTSALIGDEHYGHSLQRFEQKKAELAELAHKWSVHKAVTEAIQQTMSNLKEKRLPFVLNRSQTFFNLLTNGRYDTLLVNEDGIFEAVHSTGTRFSVAELSQATKEQSYIALRFALAQSLVETVPLPIIMDDPFVHFDRFRTEQMVQLITELEKQHQFLYFTCHEEMKTIWPDAHVIDVTTLRDERSVSYT